MQTTDIATEPAKGDAILVQEARSGLTGAFDQLVGRYFGMVYAVGLARLEDSAAAEDLAQEVFLRAYLCLDRLQHPELFAAWVTRMARNLATDWQRRGARGSRIATMVSLDETHLEVPDARAPGAREKMETEEEQQIVRAALRQLSPSQREIVLLRFMEDLTQDEIGARLGVNRSSVSRSLDKALGRMRGALVPVLRDAMPRLRARKTATARTLALVGATAGLASAQKAAMAAAAGAGIHAAETHTVSSGAGAAVSATLSLVKSISGVLTSGGLMMGTGKGIAVAAAALLTVGGGTYLVAQAGGGPGTAASVAAPAPPGQSLIPPQAAPAKTYKDWNEMARDYLAQNPANTGLAKLVEALSMVNAAALGQQKRALDSVVADGWRTPNPQLDAAIRAQTPAIEAAFAAAQSAPFTMPPATDASSPVPNFLAAQTLFKLMLGTARMAEAAGDANGAAQRAVSAARLAESFCAPDNTLISRLIGIAGVSSSCRTLASVLRNPAVSPQMAESVAASLKDLESKRTGFAEGVRGEARHMIGTIRHLKSDPVAYKNADPGTKALLDSIKSVPAFEQEMDRVYRTIAANYEKPVWQREKLDMKKLAAGPLTALALPNLDEAATRADSALAWLRLCEALAATRAGNAADAAAVGDPFVDRPLGATADRCYSVGPDATDQQGALSYDPTNGTVSAGDIVALK